MIATNLAHAPNFSDPGAAPEVKTRILVVDDVADNRDILVRRLVRRGFEAAEAANGRQALDLIASESYDVVLLDIMMPDMSGNEVLREIRHKYSDIELPVIMVSAKSQSEDVVESLSLGANDYVTKPIDFNVALARISNQVARKHAADVERVETLGLRKTVHAVSEKSRQSEEQLQFLAYHDPLTGLLNRSAFRDLLNQALDDLAVSDTKPAVLFIDLDRFKSVNDNYGHQVGDQLLKAVADRLRAVISPGIELCRLGGDEFGALILGHSNPDYAMAQADTIVEALQQPFETDGRILQIGASCGVALASSVAAELDVLVKAADLAMYHAKKSGRSNTVLFEPRMLLEQDERRALEEDLRAAVRHGDFKVFYQPLMDVTAGKVRSFEALIRWPHKTRGLIAPDTFVPIAEETGLIINIGEWVLREACKQAMQWSPEISIAVNLSPLQFRNPSLIGSIVGALAASGLSPSRLELEITETALLGAETRNHEILRSIRNLGVRVSIDDFGTGYSSMSYLQNFAVDKIKIDKRFVQGLDNGKSSAAIIQAIINLGIEIGVGTAAEGVETTEQLNSVLERGCTLVQGYLFSRPLTAEDATRFAVDNMAGNAMPGAPK